MTRDQRALALGGIIVSMGWIGLRGIPRTMASLQIEEEAVAQRAELVVRAHWQVEELPRLGDSIQALERIATLLPQMLLVGEDPETASIDLMSRMRGIAGSRPMTLVGFSPRESGSRSGPFVLASLTATVQTDFQELLFIFDSIEADPAIGLESIDVRAADSHSQEGAETLTAELGLVGWYRLAGQEVDRTSESPGP